MIKISVIIPIYNMGKYLEECLQSVVNQTLQEIEIICINDGSTDHSLEILQKFAAKYQNIRVVNQDNRGVSYSRNLGIELARGQFVAFIDPDDFYPDLDILETLYNCAIKHNAMICGGSMCHYAENKYIYDTYGWRSNYIFENDGIKNYRDYQFHYGFYRFIYNLEFLLEHKIKFPPFIRYQDPPFMVNAMIHAGSFYAMKKMTYCYRVGHKKLVLTHDKTIDFAKGVVEVLNLSRKNRFEKLHTLVVQLLQNELSAALYKHVLSGSAEALNMVHQINESIDKDLLVDFKGEAHLLSKDEINARYLACAEKEADFLRTLRKYDEIIIYGAGKVGGIVAEYLNEIKGVNVIGIAVSENMTAPQTLKGFKVRKITELTEYKDRALVLIATFSNLHDEIRETLESMKFRHILPINFNEQPYLVEI